MKEKELFEKQYGQKKLIYRSSKQYLGIRKLLSRYDIDRSSICKELVSAGHRVLDIGCCDGQLLRTLSDKFNELYGFDISGTIIKEAHEKTLTQLPSESHKFRWIDGNASERLPFDDNFFDVVVSVATLQFVYDLFNAVKEIKRVVRQGGEVIVEVPNLAYVKGRFGLLFGCLPVTSAAQNWQDIGWDGGSVHYFTAKKLCWLLETNGFRITAKSGSGFLANLRNWWLSLLTADIIIKAVKL